MDAQLKESLSHETRNLVYLVALSPVPCI